MRAIFPVVCLYVIPGHFSMRFPAAFAFPNCSAFCRMVRTSSLKELWLTAPAGRLSPWEQARALALRDVYRELHDGRNLSDEVSAHFHPCVDRCTTYQAIFRCKVICGLSHHLVGVCLTRAQPDLYSIGSGSVRNHSLVYAEPSGTACGTVRISMKPRKIAAW